MQHLFLNNMTITMLTILLDMIECGLIFLLYTLILTDDDSEGMPSPTRSGDMEPHSR